MITVYFDVENDDGTLTCFDLDISPRKEIVPTPLKSYSFALYRDSEDPIFEGEVYNHDERAGPFQLVRRVINLIKEV